MKNKFFALLGVGALVAVAPNAQAQYGSYNPFEIGASGGIAFPTGDLGTASNTGYNIALSVGYRPQYTPIAVRAEAAWNQFGAEGGGANFNVPSFTGNVEVGLPLGMSFSPYAIGGAGLYRPNVDFSGGGSTQTENRFGWNIGGGVKIPLAGFHTFIEARYNSVNIDGGTLSFVPLTFGIMF
ncbi:MAG TPA: outer membrane beta-barrel protein [Gemmatimonadaceae bacterium]|nr:outer membrane beta-barrel protein [Gemmatimonadaceae bacterium]